MNRSLLNKAVANNESPTPGYMFQEIAKMTLTSAEASFKIEKFLFSKLAKGGPYVKWKALTIIKHVAAKGRADFKRNAMHKAPLIKELLQFRGEKDPIKGDQKNLQVRKAAKAALAVVFSTTQKAPVRKAVSSRMEGISGDSYGNRAPAPAPASSWSFRSSTTKTPSRPPLGSPPTGWSFSSNRGTDAIQNSQPSYSAPESSFDPRSPRGYSNKEVPQKPVRSKKSSRSSRKGVRGDWGSSTGLKSGHSAATASSARSSVSNDRDHVTGSSLGDVGTARSDGTFERTVVDQIVAAAGIRVEPSKADLEKFCRRCRTLSPDIVVPLLEKKLSAKKWQTRIKTLAVVSALASDRHCKKFRDYFEEMDSQWLETAAEDSSKKVRARVGKVYTLLYPDDDGPEDDADARGEAVAPEEDSDFLGLSGGGDDSGRPGDGDGGDDDDDDAAFFGGLSLADGNEGDDGDSGAAADGDDNNAEGGFSFITGSAEAGADAGGDDFGDDDDGGMFGGMHMGGEEGGATPAVTPPSDMMSDLFSSGGSGNGGIAVTSTVTTHAVRPGAPIIINDVASMGARGVDVFASISSASPVPTPLQPSAGGFPGMGMVQMPMGRAPQRQYAMAPPMRRPGGMMGMAPAMARGGMPPMNTRRMPHNNNVPTQVRRIPSPSGAGLSISNAGTASTGFGFMQQQQARSNDAFDFVGDLM